MCGIIGLYQKNTIDIEKFSLELDKLINRGPDNQSVLKIQSNLVFGHTRLSIIDLDDKSNQPFSVNKYTITYNGEIYNYLELKNELEKKGVKFRTKGDTEVVLRAYIFWGERCVDRFNGMWAFSIFDPGKNIIFSSRDRFGIKPFYYFKTKNKFMFSSKVSPIISYFPELKRPNKEMINEFLHRGYIDQFEDTWFEEIKRLLPGCSMVYDFEKVEIKRYYQKDFNPIKIQFEEAKKNFLELFRSSVDLRLRSDVNISSTLTSGLDSSSIVSIVSNKLKKPLKTYTLFSKNKFFSKNDKNDFSIEVDLDESKSLKFFKDYNLDSTLIEVNHFDYLSKLKECILHIESGHAAPAIVGINELYKKVKKDGNKVLLEGQGADEIFGGYVTEFFPEVIRNNLKNLPYLTSYFFKMKKIYSIKIILLRYFNGFKKHGFIGQLKVIIIRSRITKKTKFRNLKYHNLFDYNQTETLPNLLLYGDALSMSNSIETRFPFLDFRIVNFANKLPLNYKIYFEKGKYILRESIKDLIPKSIYENKIKNGFAIPIDTILRESEDIKDFLYSKSSFDFFDNNKLKVLLDNFYLKKTVNSSFIFKILTTKIWFSIFIQEKN